MLQGSPLTLSSTHGKRVHAFTRLLTEANTDPTGHVDLHLGVLDSTGDILTTVPSFTLGVTGTDIKPPRPELWPRHFRTPRQVPSPLDPREITVLITRRRGRQRGGRGWTGLERGTVSQALTVVTITLSHSVDTSVLNHFLFGECEVGSNL